MLISEKRQDRRLEMMSPARIAGLALLPFVLLLLMPEVRGQDCPADAKTADLGVALKDLQGKTIALSNYKGKVVLLDFWATWCPPCRKEIPGYIELYNAYKTRGFVVVGVSMDDSIPDVKKFTKHIKINYPILMGEGHDELQAAFGELPLPTSFVIARDGRICAKHDGLTAKEQIEREINALF